MTRHATQHTPPLSIKRREDASAWFLGALVDQDAFHIRVLNEQLLKAMAEVRPTPQLLATAVEAMTTLIKKAENAMPLSMYSMLAHRLDSQTPKPEGPSAPAELHAEVGAGIAFLVAAVGYAFTPTQPDLAAVGTVPCAQRDVFMERIMPEVLKGLGQPLVPTEHFPSPDPMTVSGDRASGACL